MGVAHECIIVNELIGDHLMKIFSLVFVIVLSALSIWAQESDIIFHVKYISAETVYLDGGAAKGLHVGDKLLVRSKKKVVAELEVIYVAEHSASCRIIKKQGTISTGDMAVVYVRAEPRQPEEPQQIQPEPAPPKQPQPHPEKKKPVKRRTGRQSLFRISGSISAQWYQWDDRSESNLDFSQPTVRFNLRMRNLWNKDYHLRIRTRSRYNQRTREYTPDVPKEEWRNRVYEFSFSYENSAAPVNYKMGRIISNYMSGVGYIDGLQVQYNPSSTMRFGVFFGTQPDWRTSSFQTSIQKFGGFWNYTRGEYRSGRISSTIAAAAEYHSSVVSREFVYFQNSFTYGGRLNLYQSAEIDINRSWRKERSGEQFSLTNLFLSARYRFRNWFNIGLSFDNRKNYWTYETRSIEDIIFDDALRRGLRGNLSLRLPGKVFVFSTVGMRTRETDSRATYSYAGGIRKADFIVKRLSFSVNYAGFTSQFTDGYTASVRLGKSFLTGQRIELGVGNYAYRGGTENTTRNNQWARLNTYFPLFYRLFLYGQYEYNWGDDIQGQRITAELGYRF